MLMNDYRLKSPPLTWRGDLPSPEKVQMETLEPPTATRSGGHTHKNETDYIRQKMFMCIHIIGKKESCNIGQVILESCDM